jgi:hypothetical protein
MALPLFDDVVLDAVPPRDGPVRIHEGDAPTAAHTTARLLAAPFELDDHRPKSHRPALVARHGTPAYFAYWNAFKRGADGQSPPGVEHDEVIARYAADGFNTGRIVYRIREQQRVRDEQRARERRAR